MAERAVRVRMSTAGQVAPGLLSLRRDYAWAPADAGVLEPAEIVARLHAEIAAKSPAHARLVANWDRVQAERRAALEAEIGARVMPSPPVCHFTDREKRISRYRELTGQGLTMKQAAAEMGVHIDTARAYNREVRP